MNFVSKITNNQSSVVCSLTSVFCILSSVLTNKPNSPIVQTDVKSFTTMNYTILTSLTKVKNKPNQTQLNPKQSQNKPNTNLSSNIAVGDPIITNFETAHIMDIYQRNPLSHLFRRPIITCECYGHNEDIILGTQFLKGSFIY